jgi:hypothetical protein
LKIKLPVMNGLNKSSKSWIVITWFVTLNDVSFAREITSIFSTFMSPLVLITLEELFVSAIIETYQNTGLQLHQGHSLKLILFFEYIHLWLAILCAIMASSRHGVRNNLSVKKIHNLLPFKQISSLTLEKC